MNKEVFPFFNRIAELYSNKLPFVVYRKPNEELVSLITQNEPIVYELTNFKESGFVFVPFHNTGKINSFFNLTSGLNFGEYYITI